MPNFLFQRPADGAPLLTKALTLAVLGASLAGCASKNPLIDEPAAPAARATGMADQAEGVQTTKNRRFLGILSPYRIPIQQGNFVSQEMVDQLKQGMTREQVRFALGTPLLTDLFHADRWDYPFRLQRGNGEVISSKVTVYFKDNLLERIEGGDLPNEADYLARLTGKGTKRMRTDAGPKVPEAPSSALPPGDRSLPRLP